MNRHFCEKVNIVPGIMPVNLAAGANNGDWVSLKDFYRCAVVFLAGVGASGQDPTITLLQAKNVSGGSSKPLDFIDIRVKDATALTGVGQFTQITQAAANTFTVSGIANAQKLWVIDIRAEDLDVNDGFTCLQASVGDVGSTSQLGVLWYEMHEPRELGIDGTLPSAIVN